MSSNIHTLFDRPSSSRNIVQEQRENTIPRTLNESTSVSTPISSIFSTFSNIRNRLRRQNDIEVILEEVADIHQDYDRFTQQTINNLTPQTLYSTGNALLNTGLITHRREVYIDCVNNDVIILPVLSTAAINNLRHRNYKIVHIGAITIAIKGLVRLETGTKALITILDTRWNDIRKGLIALIEVDLNSNKGVFYCCPNFALTVRDMAHISIGIQTKGFEAFKGDNLAINIGFLGKASNNLKHRYKVKIDDVVKVLTSKKVCLLKPPKFSPEELAGLPWNLELFSQNSTLVPQESIIYKDANDKYSVRFYNYQQGNNGEESEEDQPSTSNG